MNKLRFFLTFYSLKNPEKVSQVPKYKILSSTALIINKHIRMIFEESCETED